MNSKGIFFGSSNSNDPACSKAASQGGQRLAEQGVGIVYSGRKVGLMGPLLTWRYRGDPAVVGRREIAHTGLTYLHVVTNMHERKMKMAALTDAFIALPGGAGTLEEIFE